MFGWRRRTRLSRRDRREVKALQAHAERQQEMLRAKRIPLDELDSLVLELVGIGQDEAFLDGGAGQERAREIGEILYETGGKPAMRAAYDQVEPWLPTAVRELQRTWHLVGDWQA